MHGVRGRDRMPGEFRRLQNFIGSHGQPLEEARFVPPPMTELNACLDDFEKALHEPSEVPFLIRLALIHYQFEAIHPFEDGNGRIGRLIMPVLLCANDLLTAPLLQLSAHFEKHRTEYVDLLLAVSQRGAWLEWIKVLSQGSRTASPKGRRTVTSIVEPTREISRNHRSDEGIGACPKAC